MATRLLRFGSTDLPPSFGLAQDDILRVIEPAKIIRDHGARLITGYAQEKVIPVRGGFIDGPIPLLWGQSDLRGAMDELKELLASGPQNLYIWGDRYYRNVQGRVSSFSFVDQRWDKLALVELEFIAGDPFLYSTTLSTDTWTPVTGTRNITPNGNAPVLPIYTLRTGSASISWTFTNSTTGEFFTLNGIGLTVGDDIAVDCSAQTCTISGVDRMDLFDGVWPRLNPTTNTLTTTQTTGTISQVVTSFRDRFW